MSVLRQEVFSAANNKHFEGAMTQGNGYLNVRASFEEDLSGENQGEIYWRLPANVTLEKIRNPVSKWGIYVPGLYGLHPMLGEEIVNLPYVLGINLYCEEEKFCMEKSHYTSFEKVLDMKTGILERNLIWYTKKGIVEIKWRRYLSMENPHAVVQVLTFTARQEVKMVVENFIDGDVTTNGYCHFKDWSHCNDDDLSMLVTLDSGQQVAMKTWSNVEATETLETTYAEKNHRISEYKSFVIRAGLKYVYRKTSLISENTEQKNSISSHQQLGYWKNEIQENPLCEATHVEIWKNRWKTAAVTIEGDAQLQASLNFSIYHLLRSANRNSCVAIDAKGFAGEAYFGHYFWDTEVYMLPFYNCTWPEQAKRLVEYRYKALQGAKENAKKYGYEGARYPWEACATGREQCSNWQYADLEVHITADVVYGIWMYYAATGDQKFLTNEGIEIMVETSRYWLSRVHKAGEQYHLNGVMGPDEYMPFTSNNAFTNFMVSFALKKTIETLQITSTEQKAKLKVTDGEVAQFQEISDNLVLCKEDNGIVWQCQGFEAFEEVSFDDFWIDRTKPFGVHISQEKNYRSKALKQADVMLLMCLFEESFSDATVERCMEYYERYTTHDSSLSYIIHSMVYGRLRDVKKSYEFMEKSMNIDMGEHGAAEGIHIANAGGLWQGVVKGFGGFKGFDENLKPVIHKRLPQHIESITYQVVSPKNTYEITVAHNKVEVRSIS